MATAIPHPVLSPLPLLRLFSPLSFTPAPAPCPPPPLPRQLSSTPPLPFSLPHPCITAYQVKGELRKLRSQKVAGPDNVRPRLLKTCAELGEPLQQVFNMSLQLGRVPSLWKTLCIIPVPKKNQPSELNDIRPVALTSHLMKTLELLFLDLLRPQVQHSEDSLQFAYRTEVTVEDAIHYLLH